MPTRSCSTERLRSSGPAQVYGARTATARRRPGDLVALCDRPVAPAARGPLVDRRRLALEELGENISRLVRLDLGDMRLRQAATRECDVVPGHARECSVSHNVGRIALPEPNRYAQRAALQDLLCPSSVASAAFAAARG